MNESDVDSSKQSSVESVSDSRIVIDVTCLLSRIHCKAMQLICEGSKSLLQKKVDV
jgi:hypothetical protein